MLPSYDILLLYLLSSSGQDGVRVLAKGNRVDITSTLHGGFVTTESTLLIKIPYDKTIKKGGEGRREGGREEKWREEEGRKERGEITRGREEEDLNRE